MFRRGIPVATTILVATVTLFSTPSGAATHSALPQKDGVPTLAPLLRKVTPGVVNIAVKSRVRLAPNPLLNDPFFRHFFDLPEIPEERETQSVGSGVIVDAAKGYVLTNHHVVAGADEITVTLKDRRRLKAVLIGSDADTEIALLKIEAKNLTAVPMGDSDSLEVGDFVVAIGNPFGLGQTVTSGIVSALGRGGLSPEGYEDFIQTDASINPGNSGGALINLKGELMGINTAIIAPAGGNVGIGFAVPSNMARNVMDQLLRYGTVRRGRLGIGIQDLTPELAQALGISQIEGVIVTEVEPDSPAAQAGLKAGDVIIALDDDPIRNARDLRNRIGLSPVGRTVMLTLLRDGRKRHIEAVIGGAREDASAAGQAVPALAGAVFQDLAPGSPQYRRHRGVLVTSVQRGSRAWRAGLRQNDLILSVNRRRVESLETFERALRGTEGALALNILRGDQPRLIVVR